ncbi:acyl-CoA N-acyltransferase [Lasiosphaeria hispida]|uniref:Acyl-CoA N-acyltransferase n=1 Tax=Lasiosphaeria hispida TaxID=260671 RepID=A0AAJ0HUC9_9PEZI|nr:acyl-CoA N-acyltransferase [Lasiosphaeria hispida]
MEISIPLHGFALSTDPEPLGGLIPPLRDASRKLVREWGFLQPTLASSALSPAAVHCLIDIGDQNIRSLCSLCTELKVSRTRLNEVISELVANGDIAATDSLEREGVFGDPGMVYSLTAAGAETLRAVNAYAQNQVIQALATTPPEAATDITTAFRLYTAALEHVRLAEAVSTPEPTRPTSPVLVPKPAVEIVAGYRPGILGRTLDMHLEFYHKTCGWGITFEAGLASSLSNFLARLDKPMNQVWSAVQMVPAQGPGPAVERIVGVIYIDGESSEQEGVARLRAFIVDDLVRGLGLGRKLVSAAMAFVRKTGFCRCTLTTLRILSAAIKLYEEEGFREVREMMEGGFSEEPVMVLEYAWSRDG